MRRAILVGIRTTWARVYRSENSQTIGLIIPASSSRKYPIQRLKCIISGSRGPVRTRPLAHSIYTTFPYYIVSL